MRVLHLTRDFPPRAAGGLSTAVGGMVRTSTRAGLACAVLSFDDWRPRARAGSGPVGAPPRPEPGLHAQVLRLSRPAELDAAHAFADAWGPDLVHVHDDLLWPVAAEIRARRGIPAVLTVHVLQAEQSRLRGLSETTLALAAQRRALAEADTVLAPSRVVLGLLRTCAPEIAARLRLCPLGIDDAASARAAAAAPHDGALVLFVGRLADINGVAELLAAVPAIVADAPQARVIIAGGLPHNRKAERRWHRRWRQDAAPELVDRVEFTGWLAPAALARLYARAAVVVAPSWFETYGQVVLEAMLHGAPIAAARAGAVVERIAHDRNGLLFAPRDPAALAEAVCALLADPERARRLARAAAAEARARWTWDQAVATLVRAYDDAVTARR
ncbi:glycosyltransferase family 4 protein [Haliangium sp.]|uniref:glycosyltransferase family 4 protein n=1 Tax=Haliangium sp. TaxID=2663208 RepID=UPI003D114C27